MGDMPASKVCIIGAGLGGLALARSLARNGIPAVIYDRSPAKPRHGYGITLHSATYVPLSNVLGLDELAFRRRVAVDASSGGSGTLESSSTSFRANRQKLELLLREGLDIRWEHQLDKLEPSGTGSTSLHFSKQEPIPCDRVIAADGVHSRVRMSTLPQIKPTILPIVAFNGKRRVPISVFDTHYSALRDCNVLEIRHHSARLNIQINDIDSENVSISWIYSRAARPGSDSLHRPDRPNSGAEEIPEDFFSEIEQLSDLAQPFKDVFNVDVLRKERILSWLMRTVEVGTEDLRSIADQGVFLIGDAIHAEPILGGNGANSAIRDGIELAEHLSAYGFNSAQAWYDTKHDTWRQGVESSKKAIAEMHRVDRAAL